jgi:hypothetical protein
MPPKKGTRKLTANEKNTLAESEAKAKAAEIIAAAEAKAAKIITAAEAKVKRTLAIKTLAPGSIIGKPTVKPTAKSVATTKNESVATTKDEPTYHERQVAYLCGKHALNNVLQEEKFLWSEDGKSPNQYDTHYLCKVYNKEIEKAAKEKAIEERFQLALGYLNGSKPLPKETNHKNEAEYLTQLSGYYEEQNATVSKYGSLYNANNHDAIKTNLGNKMKKGIDYFVGNDEQCVLGKSGKRGNFPILFMKQIIEQLNYRAELIWSESVIGGNETNVFTKIRNSFLEHLPVALKDSTCLGVVLNKDGNHWTGIVKYNGVCNTKNPPMYSYADSLAEKCDTKCYTEEELLLHVRSLSIHGAVFIYTTSSSYKSVADKLRDGLPLKGGRSTRRQRTTYQYKQRRRYTRSNV